MSLFLLKRICSTTALLALASCHDAPRTNPFDPALTPPVELQVALDDRAGAATLTWSQYEGQQLFREYRVLRNIADRKSVDTLVHIAAVAQITFVDTTLAPNTAYVYRVETLNVGGYAAPSEEKGIAGYAAGPVSLVEVEVDAHQGQTRLRWTHFTGARFQGYRVERRSGEEERFSVVQHLAGLSDTTWTDAELRPEVSYFYQVVVVAAGSDWPSTPSSRQGFSLEAVQLSAETNKAIGRAQLRWTPFQGPDFEGYRVERRSEEEVDFGTIGRLEVVADTAYTDTTLAPEVSYFYRVVVEAGGRDWPSAPSSPQGFELRGVNVSILPGFSTQGISLGWLQFFGPGFQRYRVLRRVVGTDVVETIAEVTQRDIGGENIFTDTSAQHGVEYEYWVVVDAAGQEVVGTRVVASFDLPPAAMKPPVFSAATASAALRWSLYQGPHFRAYRVERRTAGLTPLVVAELEDLTAASYVDTGLAGNTEYFYRVVVETQRGEEVLSEEVSGIFHQLLTTWPLEMEEGEYVRLYWEGDHLTALVAGRQRVRLFLFDAQGALMEEQGLLDYPRLDIEPRSVATALNPDGSRFLSFGEAEALSLLRLGPDGHAIQKSPQPVFVDSLTSLKVTQGEGASRIRLDSYSRTIFDNVVVADKAGVLFAEDFEGGNPEEVWDILNGVTMVDGYLLTSGVGGVVAKEEEAWQDYRLEADVILSPGGQGRIFIGNLLNTVIFLELNEDIQRLTLFLDPPEGDPRSFRQSFSVLSRASYRLGLGLMGGQVSASVQGPMAWRTARERDVPWACLAGIEGSLLLLAEPQSHKLPWESEAFTDSAPLDSAISEVRIWKIAGSTRRRVGICLPEEHQVRTGVAAISNGKILTSFVGTNAAVLGTQVGQGEGAFLYPLSFDGAADGRFYVLDAGNARIQVFDTEGKYLTQWGRKGRGEGEFDFGSGRAPEDFAGSVAVDSEGYIYVADVGNQRIKKFAP